jgi:hypothetical protein
MGFISGTRCRVVGRIITTIRNHERKSAIFPAFSWSIILNVKPGDFMVRRVVIGLVGALLFAAVGCSPYVDDYYYAPRPALAEIPPAAGEQAPPLSASVSVIGIHREDRHEHIPLSVEVRLRLDNDGSHTLQFDPKSLALSDGSLAAFLPPIVRPPDRITLAPAESVMLDIFFPFPDGVDYEDLDMQSLQIRWQVLIDGKRVGQVVYFHRIVTVYYRPYPPPVFVGGGVIFVHRR